MRLGLKIAIGAAAAGALVLVGALARSSGHDSNRSGYIRAREMSPTEAFRALDAFQAAGQIAYTRVDGGKFVDMGSYLDAVQFHYAGKPLSVTHVTPQFAVFLVRLSQVMRRGFGAVAIEHMGIYPGRGVAADVHNRGSAIDVGSIVTIDGTFSVAADWGSRPKRGAGYRLTPSDRAYHIFRTLYQVAAHEADDDPNGDRAKPATAIGDPSLIVTPDHPNASLAAAHRDHVHIQIGPTRA